MPIVQSCLQFWLCHPSLLYGLTFFLGLSCHFGHSCWLILPCITLWLPFILAARQQNEILKFFILSVTVFFTAWTYAAAYYSFPVLPDQGLEGKARIHIKSIRLQHSLFGPRWVYRCEIQQFFSDQSSFSLISFLPCLIILSTDKPHPVADQDYWVAGKLIQTQQGQYRLKVSQKQQWMAVPGSKSLAEERYQWKRKVIKWIESHFQYPTSIAFLGGLSTGEFDDYWMKQQFARFGLQHILAISGFHFGIIASFLSFILRLFFSQRIQVLSLLFLLAGYSLFLGAQASILRAWIMCSLTLVGYFIEKETNSLNVLGLACLVILGYDPLFSLELGFQLSFAITAAILLFYSPLEAWMNHFLTRRSLSEVLKMNHQNQYGYCLIAFLRKGLALTLAVNIFSLPLTLYYFHQFPWMSLLYNLFFPLLASASLCLLLLGSLFSFIPVLANTLHTINDCYTNLLLELTYQVPTKMDCYLQCDSFPLSWLIFYLCLASFCGIIGQDKLSLDSKKFSFI